MKLFAPDYYGDFACLMGACSHSCCVGWEIDIDEHSLARYQRFSGDLGERLNASIELGESPHFRLTAGERCPFLTDDGLCELILSLGADSLCQICADHPRYRSFFSDHTEVGLGMCCEAACRLILSHAEPVRLQAIGEDEQPAEPLSEEEAELLALRGELIAIVQDRSKPVLQRIEDMLAAAELCFSYDVPQWAALLEGLERLDEGWTDKLHRLHSQPKQPLPDAPWLELALEQLMVYLLQRHLPAALEDGDLFGRVLLCAALWHTIRAMLAREDACSLDKIAELCRLCSSELEYSDENICAILDALESF